MKESIPQLELLFEERFDTRIKQIFSQIETQFIDGPVMICRIKVGELDKLRKIDEYKSGNLLLGKAQVWYNPKHHHPEKPVQHIRFRESKVLPQGLVITPYKRAEVLQRGGMTIDAREGIRRLEYDGTFLAIFEEMKKYLIKSGKSVDDNSFDIVIYRSEKARSLLDSYRKYKRNSNNSESLNKEMRSHYFVPC